jgi:monofunctional biosynthetic peptidoglycan transglycosylase
MKRKTKKGLFGRFIKTVFVLAVLAAIGFVGFYFVYPDVAKLKRQNPGKTSFMEYREKEWTQKGKKIKLRKKWVSLKYLSPYLVKAVIIAEDDKFWSHRGFDLDAIQKALEKDVEKGKFKFGGSTISQQLTKNLYLTPDKNPVRKLKEAIITWRIERALSKRRILEIYLNVVEWGEGIFGAETASLHYFGKPAALLTAQEAARLAVILPNPRKYRLDGSSQYVEKRARIIYGIMVRRGIVVPEYDEVLQQKDNGESPPTTENNPPATENNPQN